MIYLQLNIESRGDSRFLSLSFFFFSFEPTQFLISPCREQSGGEGWALQVPFDTPALGQPPVGADGAPTDTRRALALKLHRGLEAVEFQPPKWPTAV